MCLAIPGRLVERYDANGLPMGRVDYSGTLNTACLAYVPEAKTGEYLLVHAGFALNVLDEAEAAKSLALWDEMVELATEEDTDIFGMPLDLEPGGDRTPADQQLDPSTASEAGS